MRSSGVLSATFLEIPSAVMRFGRNIVISFHNRQRLRCTCCALPANESCCGCLAETLTEWRLLSAQRRASSRLSTDGAAILVRPFEPPFHYNR